MDIVAVDLKLPSSTGLNAFWDRHKKFLKIASKKEAFLKTVICRSTQKEDLKEALNLVKEVNKYMILVLQPNTSEDHGQLDEKLQNFKDICTRNSIITCIIPQVHKIIGIR